MKEKRTGTSLKKMILSAMFLALGIVLPFLTGQIPTVGSMLLPMHIPVLLCGYICGGWWGLAVGLLCPLLRSLLLGMPPMFPVAVSMAAELAVYGCMTGLLYRAFSGFRPLGRVLASLLFSMAAGRLVWGAVRWGMTVSGSTFSWQMFLSGAVTTALPGIVLQIALIPALLLMLEKAGVLPLEG